MVDWEGVAKEEADSGPSDDQLKSISGLVERAIKIEDYIADQKEKLEQASQNLNKIIYDLLPEAMEEAGVNLYGLDGTDITVSMGEEVYASITNENKPRAHELVRKNQDGDLIRNEFKIGFGVGEGEAADAIADELRSREIDFDQKEYIHPRTIPGYIRTRIEEEPALRDDPEFIKLFSVHFQKKAKVNRPK